ncbi:MAG: hypothetical protein K6C12_13265 [Oscillospiraceae bacterium]|nr:hypothetical protein [Oscillospiraceae bacterium]
MNTMNRLTGEQALRSALTYLGLENSEFFCLSNRLQDGFFRLSLWTPYLKYEIFVDSADGEVAGIDMQPVPYREALALMSGSDGNDTVAA